MEKEGIEHITLVAPNMLLTGHDLTMCPNYTIQVRRAPNTVQARHNFLYNTDEIILCECVKIYCELCRKSASLQNEEPGGKRDLTR